MTTPPEDLEGDAFENDPTGIRDLLRSLPGPGPMPPHVSDRITAALAAEQRARAGVDHSKVTPLGAGSRSTRKTSGSRRWMQVTGGLVAAAAVAAVAVVGVNSLRHDSATTNAAPSAQHTASADQLADRVKIESSGTNYTNSTFNTQAASMAAGSSSTDLSPALVTEFGALARPSAIAQCARAIGGSLLDDPTNIKVDLATFDGKPAVVIVVTNHGTKSAFAVSTTCSRTEQPYATPRTI